MVVLVIIVVLVVVLGMLLLIVVSGGGIGYCYGATSTGYASSDYASGHVVVLLAL